MGRTRQQAGDTIVEVLISVAVISFVLGGAYSIASRTLNNSRQAQEHSEALQLANAQIELLSSYAAKATTPQITDLKIGTKCMKAGAEPTSGACVEQDDEIGYQTSVTYSDTGKHYNVRVQWPAVTGQGDESISLAYRPYAPNDPVNTP